jgi:hypothetical protein
VSSGLLEGVTVVDLTQALAGPLRHAHARTRSGSAKGSEPRLSKGLEQGDRDLVNSTGRYVVASLYHEVKTPSAGPDLDTTEPSGHSR